MVTVEESYGANLLQKVYEFVKIRAMAMLSSSTSQRISAFYAASFVSYGIHLPFFPLVLAARGLDDTAIAVVVAVPMMLRVSFASLLGALADRLGDRRRAVTLYAAATLVGALTLIPAGSFWTLMAATVALTLPWTGLLPVSDAVATSVARRGEGVYGAMRVWGSIGFVVANLAAGQVAARGGADAILAFLIFSFALQLAATRLLPAAPREAAETRRVGMVASFRSLTADRRLMAILAGAALLQASHAMLHGFASLHWASLGFSGGTIGALWAVGVLGEILLFTFSAPVLARIGAQGLLVVAVIGAMVRWSLFPLLGGTAAPWFALQLLHAATFGATHLGAIHVLTHAVDERRAATAQGLMVSINGFVMALATLASGPLYGTFGGGAFVAMAGIAVVGGAVLVFAKGLQPHRAGLGGKSVEPS